MKRVDVRSSFGGSQLKRGQEAAALTAAVNTAVTCSLWMREQRDNCWELRAGAGSFHWMLWRFYPLPATFPPYKLQPLSTDSVGKRAIFLDAVHWFGCHQMTKIYHYLKWYLLFDLSFLYIRAWNCIAYLNISEIYIFIKLPKVLYLFMLTEFTYKTIVTI